MKKLIAFLILITAGCSFGASVSGIAPRSSFSDSLFKLYDANDANDTFSFDVNDSNLGIGTSDPNALLDIGGDLTVDTNTLYVDKTNDKVGIGTTNPGSKLTVSGGEFQLGDSNSDAIIKPESDSYTSFQVEDANGTRTLFAINTLNTTGTNYDGTQIGLLTDDIDSWKENTIHLGGDLMTHGNKFYYDENTVAMQIMSNAVRFYLPFAGGYNQDFIIQTAGNEAHDVIFKPMDSDGSIPERMRLVGDTGNVGIGTTSPDANLAVVGDMFVGDGGTTNYTEIKSDGEINLHGTARVYDGHELPAKDFKAPGAGAATLVNRGLGTAWRFDNGSEESIHVGMRIPSKWVDTEDITVVLIWDSPATSADCDWEVRYLFRASNEDMTETTPDGTIQDYKTSSATANGLIHSTFTIPTADFDSGDKKLMIQVFRDGNDGSDTLGNDAFLHATMTRGIADKIGGSL